LEDSVATLGEIDISFGSSSVGRLRVHGIHAESALFPRLVIDVGVSLYPVEGTSASASSGKLRSLELHDALGELRLSEHGDVLGSALWNEARPVIRAYGAAAEHHMKFVCDLDFWRLEQVERRRAGAAPKLWLQVWPRVVADGEALEVRVPPIPMDVPREKWLEFYSQAGGTQYEILEVRYSPKAAEQFARALSRTREARSKILEGEYDAAVGLCRNVIEALGQELRTGETGEDPLGKLFLARTDERRAKEYSGIVSRLRQLASFAHHELGDPVTYSREEAAFVVRLTESVLALVGRFTTNQ
jgi:hypothetical protein